MSYVVYQLNHIYMYLRSYSQSVLCLRALLHIASVNEVTSKAVKMYSDIEVQVTSMAKSNSNKKPPTPILFINNDINLVRRTLILVLVR